MGVAVKVEGVQETRALLERYGLRAHAKIADAQAETALEITGDAKRLCPVDFGRLRASIRPRFDRFALSADVYTDVDYAADVEYGTRPHMPPVDAVAPWALRHGVSAWAVAMSIKRKGTRAHPYMRPAGEAGQARYVERLARALEEAEV